MNYRLAPLAIADLDQIATYIDQRSSHIILYRVVDTAVEIVRVIHGARDRAAVLNEASPGNNEPSE